MRRQGSFAVLTENVSYTNHLIKKNCNEAIVWVSSLEAKLAGVRGLKKM